MVDQVKVAAVEQEPTEQSLRRNLTNRHIQLIAIGGAIGTGLFMGSGKTISLAGPSIIFVYMIIGFMLFFVMRAMGELLLSNLEYKSFSDFAADLLGPWAGYFTGWTYWFCWVVTGMADVVAITAYAQFWFPGLSDWVASLAVILLLLGLNLATVKMFGEMEFWFAMIKIVAIVALIVVGLVMVMMHFKSPTGVEASFAHLWNDGGWFPKGLSGFFAGFQIAVFAFVGIELVGTTAAETKDPEKSLPRAINSIPLRIIMFYVFALIVIMSVTPWSSVVPSKSPFVELFVLVGLPAAARPDQLRGADLRGLLGQQRRVLYQPYAVRSGAGWSGAEDVRQAVEACGAGEGLNLLLHVSAGRGGDADGQPERDCRLHHDHHGVGDPVYVRLDHHPLLLRRIAKTALSCMRSRATRCRWVKSCAGCAWPSSSLCWCC